MEPYASTERSDWDQCLCWLTVTGSYSCDPRVSGLGTWGARVHMFGALPPELICVPNISQIPFFLSDRLGEEGRVCVKIQKNDVGSVKFTASLF